MANRWPNVLKADEALQQGKASKWSAEKKCADRMRFWGN